MAFSTDDVEPKMVPIRRALRDANVAEIQSMLSDLAWAPSKWKADATREIVCRASRMLDDLLSDVKEWESSAD